MALTRARVVAGDASLADEVRETITTILTAARDGEKTLREVAEMRRLLAKEKGEGDPWDLKQAAGGLVDIEFIAQGLELVHAAKAPGVLATNTRDALDNLAAASCLDRHDREVLVSTWELLSSLGQIVRLCAGGTFSPEEAPDALKALLADTAGLPDFGALQAEVADREYVVRRIFRKVIDRTQREH
jgi:glutamate-ammonia-ligase adenylyltransferase